MTATIDRSADAAWHQALFYADDDEYVRGVLRFVTSALDADRPVFVSVPVAKGLLLRAGLDGSADRVRFADMAQVGRNPSRIIPAIRAFIDEHADRAVSFVGEPIWAGRTAEEIGEATRHEALINAAFEGTGAHVLCPYDLAGLDADVLANASRTHPELLDHDGSRRPSTSYSHPHDVWVEVGVLPPPPHGARRTTVSVPEELARLRDLAHATGWAARLPEDRIEDMLVAVSELATNSLRHGGGVARIALWTEPGRLWCEIQDAGHLDDPLVGRRVPASDADHGRGLWMVNQLCDLVQLHSTAAGTTVRITVHR